MEDIQKCILMPGIKVMNFYAQLETSWKCSEYFMILLAVGGSLEISSRRETIQSTCVVIGVGVEFTVQCAGMTVACYLNPMSPYAGQLVRNFSEKICPLESVVTDSLIKHCRDATQTGYPMRLCEIIYDSLFQSLSQGYAQRVDRRITLLLHHIDKNYDQNLSIDKLAALVHLSSSRLMHLFKSNVGISIHRYLQWTRVTRAYIQIKRGLTIKEVAARSGFSDASHFCREFRKTWGVSPKRVLNDGLYHFSDGEN